MLKVVIGEDIPTIKMQIEALKYIINNDTTPKDKLIHGEALNALKAKLKVLQG